MTAPPLNPYRRPTAGEASHMLREMRGRPLCTPQQAAKILDQVGWREAPAPPPPPARHPTVEDYLAMGVDRQVAERAVASFEKVGRT